MKLSRIFKTKAQLKDIATRELAQAVFREDVNLKLVARLLSDGADPNAYVGSYTALHRAALGDNGSAEAVRLLLHAGANPFLPIEFGLKKVYLDSRTTRRDILDLIQEARKQWPGANDGLPPPCPGCRPPSR